MLVPGLLYRSAGGPLSLVFLWLHPALHLAPGCPVLVPGAAGGQAGNPRFLNETKISLTHSRVERSGQRRRD